VLAKCKFNCSRHGKVLPPGHFLHVNSANDDFVVVFGDPDEQMLGEDMELCKLPGDGSDGMEQPIGRTVDGSSSSTMMVAFEESMDDILLFSWH
jgi:hypothetical protein